VPDNALVKMSASALAFLVVACSRSTPATGGAAASSPSASAASVATSPGLDAFLPDIAGPFQGEPATHRDPDPWVRRIYARGKARVNVTLGSQGGGGKKAFERWVSMSIAYPQIPLRAPPDEVNGFFDCRADDAGASCDGHIHFRSGLHLELFGGGTVTRDQLLALIDGLPIEAMAARQGDD